MDRWFGKYWQLRCLLLLLAAGTCFVGWPWVLSEGPTIRLPRRTSSAHVHLSPSGICPLILQDREHGVYAWDWKTGHRWLICKMPSSGLLCPICVEGRTEKVAFRLDGIPPTIVIANVASPGHRTYALQNDLVQWDLITVTSSGEFAVILDHRTQDDRKSLQVIDLATKKIVHAKSVWGDIAVVAGGDELEITDVQVSPWVQARWRIDERGQLVATKREPIDIPQIYRPVLVSISPDGRYEAGIDINKRGRSPSDNLGVRERVSRIPLESPPQFVGSNDFVFSADSKYLFLMDINSVAHVFDLQKNSIVATAQESARKRWLVWELFLSGKILGITSLVLALRHSSFEIASVFYILAVVFLDSSSIGMALWLKSNALFVASYACLVAIGAYWASQDRALWARLGLGFVAFAVLLPAIWMAGLASAPSRGNRPSAYPHDAWFYAAMVVIVAAAVPSGLASILTGWSLTRIPHAVNRRFQFGISSLLVATLWTGFTLAPNSLWARSESRQFMDSLALIGVLAYFFNGILVSLLTWLWFRQWSRRSLTVLTVVGMAILLVVIVNLYLIAGRAPLDERLRRVAVGVMFLAYQLAAFSFPMYLARRHGFHWTRASHPAAVLTPPETMASPADASLSPGVQSN